jgi:hypothetical protein
MMSDCNNAQLSVPIKDWNIIEKYFLKICYHPDDAIFDNIIESIYPALINRPIVIRNHDFFSDFKNIDFLFLEKKTDEMLTLTSIMSRYYVGPSLCHKKDEEEEKSASLLFTKLELRSDIHLVKIIHNLMNLLYEPYRYLSFQEFLTECPQYVSEYFLFKINLFNK